MKQTIVVFCYRGEEEILPMSISQARRAFPLASIHLYDDKADPLPSALVDGLKEMAGVAYSQTTFDRGYNLNGAECIRGELAAMKEACDIDENTDGFVIKMDPDTLVLRSQLVLDAMSKGATWISHNSIKGHFAGMFYMMRLSILNTVLDNARKVSLPDNAAEDEVIGALCYLAAHKGAYVWTDANEPKNRHLFAAFPVQTIDQADYKEQIDYVASIGCVITVGNTNIEGMPKAYRVKIMSDLLKAFVARTSSDFKPDTECKDSVDKEDFPEVVDVTHPDDLHIEPGGLTVTE